MEARNITGHKKGAIRGALLRWIQLYRITAMLFQVHRQGIDLTMLRQQKGRGNQHRDRQRNDGHYTQYLFIIFNQK